MITKEEFEKAVKCCASYISDCDSCPLCASDKHRMCSAYLAEYIKNEPAPAATNINSNDKTLQIDDRTLLRIYQEELHNISDTITKTDYGVDYILGSIRTTLYIIEKLKGGDGNES